MKLQHLLAGLVASGATLLVGSQIYQQWQLARPDYDNPGAAYAAPRMAPLPNSTAATVTRVSDGDTITVTIDGKKERVRFCGIDAPESKQPMGKQSGDVLRQMINKAGNQVVISQIERDRYGRIVGEVFVKAPTAQQPEQELLLNYEQMKAGMAYVYRQYLDGCPSKDALVEGEQAAQKAKRGVWSNPSLVKPWDFRKQRRGR